MEIKLTTVLFGIIIFVINISNTPIFRFAAAAVFPTQLIILLLLVITIVILTYIRLIWRSETTLVIVGSLLIATNLILLLQLFGVLSDFDILYSNIISTVEVLTSFVAIAYFTRNLSTEDLLPNIALYIAISQSHAIVFWWLISGSINNLFANIISNPIVYFVISLLVSGGLIYLIYTESTQMTEKESYIRPRPMNFYILTIALFGLFLFIESLQNAYERISASILANNTNQLSTFIINQGGQYAAGLWILAILALTQIFNRGKIQIWILIAGILHAINDFFFASNYINGIAYGLFFSAVLALLLAATGHSQEYAVYFNVVLVNLLLGPIGYSVGSILAYNSAIYINLLSGSIIIIISIFLGLMFLNTKVRDQETVYREKDLYPIK